MKNRILDISDCSESPLLSSSRGRQRFYKRRSSFYDRRIQTGSSDGQGIAGLTEFYFKGVNAGSRLDYQLESKSYETAPVGPVAPANVSYQARCAERWWAEFCRWFGAQN